MSFWATVEKKVKSAAVGALVASVIAAEIDALMSGSPVPDSLSGWVRFVVITAAPPVVAFARGWAAPHTSIPPVQLAPVDPPTGQDMAG